MNAAPYHPHHIRPPSSPQPVVSPHVHQEFFIRLFSGGSTTLNTLHPSTSAFPDPFRWIPFRSAPNAMSLRVFNIVAQN